MAKLSGSSGLHPSFFTYMQKLNETSPPAPDTVQSRSKFFNPYKLYKPVSPNLKHGTRASLSLYQSGSSISSSFIGSVSPPSFSGLSPAAGGALAGGPAGAGWKGAGAAAGAGAGANGEGSGLGVGSQAGAAGAA